MNPIRAVRLAIVLLGCASALGAQTAGSSGPDEELRTWVGLLGDDERWQQAERALQRAGERALQPLLASLQGDRLEDGPRTRRVLRILGALGRDAAAAYPVLAERLGGADPALLVSLWTTLGDLVPYTSAQGDPREPQRLIQNSITAVRGLPAADRRRWSESYSRFSRRLQVDPDQDLAGLIRLVTENQSDLREVAVVELGRRGTDASSALPVIANTLREELLRSLARGAAAPRATARTTTVRTLGARPVFPGRDGFPERAAEAMIRIAPSDPRCAVAYAWRLAHDPRPEQRAAAALGAGGFGAAAGSVVPVLQRALRDEDRRVRWEAITGLGMVGPAAAAAVPDLERILGGKDRAATARAKAALRQIRGG